MAARSLIAAVGALAPAPIQALRSARTACTAGGSSPPSRRRAAIRSVIAESTGSSITIRCCSKRTQRVAPRRSDVS